MSAGKYISLSALFLLLIGILIGLSIILFQGDSSTISTLTLNNRTLFSEGNSDVVGITDRKLSSSFSIKKKFNSPFPSTSSISPLFEPSFKSTNKFSSIKNENEVSFNQSESIGFLRTTTILPFLKSIGPLPNPSTIPLGSSTQSPWTSFIVPIQQNFSTSNYEKENDEDALLSIQDFFEQLNNLQIGRTDELEDENFHNEHNQMVMDREAYKHGSFEFNQDVSEEEDDEIDWDNVGLDQIFDIAKQIYFSSGINLTNWQQNFNQILNETLNRGNEIGLLNQLNELYAHPISIANGNKDEIGRKSYENSITAFAFMSFGIFLLNQIHSLIGRNRNEESRNFQDEPVANESNILKLLFHSPYYNINDTSNSDLNSQSRSFKGGMNVFNSVESVNDIFRAVLNLVNAYTKDKNALECIWSIYCEDLDKTSANEGLYGIAARINSIGLRLIKNQIPQEFMFEAILRSLIGWDGLPCQKMFPKCQEQNSTLILKSTT